MVTQANKWGWKALAAKMLLAPVLAGSLAASAFAQSPAATGKQQPAAAARPAASPTELLKQGRAALAAGNYDLAQDLARQAGASSERWGLFGDNPEALAKDCQAARGKADKAYAAEMLKQAKELFTKAARTDAERAANLEQASVCIDRAVTLTGQPGWMDDLNPFAEKPDALKKQIDAAKAKLPRTVAAAPKTPVARTQQPLEQSAPAGTAARGGDKALALRYMDAGRRLMIDGKLGEARAQFVNAKKTNAAFSHTEDNPDRCLQDLSVVGQEKIDALVFEAKGLSGRKELSKAEGQLMAARELAVSLDLYTRGIDLELDGVRRSNGGGVPETVVASAVTTAAELPAVAIDPIKPAIDPIKPAIDTRPIAPKLPVLDVPAIDSKPLPKPEALKPEPPKLDVPALPVLPPKKAEPMLDLPTLDAPKAIKPVEPKAEKNTGVVLLDQAAAEMRKGELDIALKLAVEANNGGYGQKVKDDAQKLIVQIEGAKTTAKKKDAVQALDAAALAVNAKDYAHADKLLALIDKALLPADKAKQYDTMAMKTADEIAKLKAPVIPVPPAVDTTATAKVGGEPPAGLIPSTPTSPAPGTIDSLKKAKDTEMSALRMEGLSVEDQARKAFDRGETDLAVQMLSDFATKIRTSKLTAQQQALLLNPVERRLEGFRIIKKQVDFVTKEAKEKKNLIENKLVQNEAAVKKGEEISKRVKRVKELMDDHKYAEAEALALQTKQLDPDDEKLALVYLLARNARRKDDAEKIKNDKEQFFLKGMNETDRVGPAVSVTDPVARSLERSRLAQMRGSDEYVARLRTPVERDIELKLDKALTVEFQKAPLREVLRKFAETASMNISVDDPALQADGIDVDQATVTEAITQPISLRNVMSVILSKHRLQYVIENDVVRVTTVKKAQGRMITKVYSVMDLVTPIPDFALPEHQSLSKAIEGAKQRTMPWQQQQQTSTLQTSVLQNGNPTSSWAPTGMPGLGGNVLNNTPAGAPGGSQISPLSTSATLAPTRANHSEQLKKLITGMVRPNTWEDSGGAGKLSYYDIGGALVVNQTADVIREVTDLLDALRRLQDLSVAVEIRIVSLSESFYERIGVDFQMNIKTNNSPSFEQSLTSGQFRADPFINDIRANNVVTGWNPAAGGFTSDLGVPIRPNSYGLSVPPFGGYPGNGFGGLNLGLAFLNDIQVFMFLEAAAGDRRVNIMQAPKITLFNGQTSTVSVTDLAFFTLGLQVISANGQFVYIPQNTAIPIGQSFGTGNQSGLPGVSVTVQAVVTADRRFVRMTLAPNLSALTSSNVPLFPVTAFITPVFEGGSQGQPIPFTQFFQQPTISDISVQTTVAVPDGGTVLMGGLKTMSEGRTEAGPPILSNIPYLSRLFRNTGVGRESRNIMIMVTPRIIINSEEEERQTQPGGVGG